MSTTEHAIDALIFDLDGTLVDTLDDITDALNRALSARGFAAHTPAECRRMIGTGSENLVRAALPEHARERASEVLEAFRRDYVDNLLVRSAPYPGVRALLDALSLRSVPMCVLSNKLHEPTRRMVAALFPATAFVDAVGERPDRPRKPDPSVALELAARMHVAPERCGLVGDSGIDMQTARAAGMRAVGVTWGFREREELLSDGADALIDRPDQLLGFVRQLTIR